MKLLFLISILLYAPQALALGNSALTLTFAGDLMAHSPIHQIDSYTHIFSAIKPILQRDNLSFVNIESVVSDTIPPQGFPSFSLPTEYLDAAITSGFDVFSLANNHSFDHGYEGIDHTLKAFENRKIKFQTAFSGISRFQQTPPRLQLIKYKGLRIGFVALSDFSNSKFNQQAPYEYLFLLDETNENAIINQLALDSPNYDLVIVSYHGTKEEEYVQEVSEYKKTLFRKMISAGVDIVWGHHPHVPQPFEFVVAGGNRGLAIYSAGNLISAQGFGVDPTQPSEDNYWNNTSDGYLYSVSLDIAPGGIPNITGCEPIPIFQYILPGQDQGVVVETAEGLSKQDLSPTWQQYYLYRLDYLRNFNL